MQPNSAKRLQQGWPAILPGLRLLERRASAQDHWIIKMPTDNLQTDGQTIVGPTCWNRSRRLAGHVERERERQPVRGSDGHSVEGRRTRNVEVESTHRDYPADVNTQLAHVHPHL